MKTNMDKIEKALTSKYPVSEMELLGFDLTKQISSIHHFYHDEDDCFVIWNHLHKVFWTYPIANERNMK